MLKIIELNANYHRAYFVLSKLHRKAPPFISIGDINKAENYINKALSIDLNESYYLLEKAEVLIAKNQKEDAKKLLQTLKDLEYQEKYFIADVKRNKRKGKKLLKGL